MLHRHHLKHQRSAHVSAPDRRAEADRSRLDGLRQRSRRALERSMQQEARSRWTRLKKSLLHQAFAGSALEASLHERGRDPRRTDRPRADGGGLGRRRGQPGPPRVSDHARAGSRGAASAASRDIADYVLTYRNHKLAVIEAKAADKPRHRRRRRRPRTMPRSCRPASPIPPTAGASTGSTWRPARRAMSSAIPTPDELWAATFADAERLARPLRRRAVRGQGRHVADALLPGQRHRARAGGDRRGQAAHPADARDRHRQDRHRLPDRLEAVPEPLEPERASRTRRPRILFLADRNILADQAYNAFSAFPEDALVRIKPDEIRKKGRVPKNASIFFTIFQTFMSGTDADGQPAPYFGDYPPDFFDFIVIDECHRGGANDESNWRDILEYFAPAVQLGLTATPKRTRQRRHLRLFRRAGLHLLAEGGHQRRLPDAVQGEADRHHARRLRLHARRQGGRRRDRGGQALHASRDFNRIIEIEERERYRVKLFMEQIDQREKTLVFCATQDHALRWCAT